MIISYIIKHQSETHLNVDEFIVLQMKHGRFERERTKRNYSRIVICKLKRKYKYEQNESSCKYFFHYPAIVENIDRKQIKIVQGLQQVVIWRPKVPSRLPPHQLYNNPQTLAYDVRFILKVYYILPQSRLLQLTYVITSFPTQVY